MSKDPDASRKGDPLPWADDVDDDHYGSAYDYLSLHWLPKQAGPAVEALRKASLVKFQPGDILRAAGLPALPLDDTQVRRELLRALNDGKIQPILCVNLEHGLVIADGYHRVSFAYHLSPFRKMPLKLAPGPREAFGDAPPVE